MVLATVLCGLAIAWTTGCAAAKDGGRSGDDASPGAAGDASAAGSDAGGQGTHDGSAGIPGSDGGARADGGASSDGGARGDGGHSPSSTALDMTTYQGSNMRQGWNDKETILTPANIGASTFGKLRFMQTDGIVDSQPLYLANVAISGKGTHDVVYVVTDSDTVFAFDADDGTQLWTFEAMNPGETTGHGCPSFLDHIGISATPVIDRSQGPHGALYVVPMTTDASGVTHNRIWALDVATGAPLFGGPVEVTASYTPQGGATFTMDPSQVAEVAALTVVDGVLYTAWGDPCEYDYPDHGGWVIAYDEATLAQKAVFDTTPSGSGGLIWLGAGAPAADADGNLYYATGQGTFDSNVDGNGFPAQGDYANSVIKLSLQGNAFQVVDYFHTSAGGDMTQVGTVLFDVEDSSSAVHHLLTQTNTNDVFVVDRDSMGKVGEPLQDLVQGDYGGSYTGGPGFANGLLFYAAQWDPLRPFTTTNGTVAYRGDQPTDGQGTGTPSISSNGANDAILWKIDHLNQAQLFHAYDPNNLATILYSSDTNSARDGLTPPTAPNLPQNSALTVVDGKVYVPDGNAHGVAVYGLLP